MSTFVTVATLALLTVPQAQAQTATQAEVRSIRGSATVSTDGAPGQPLKTGAFLSAGSTISTSPDSEVDLFLGPNAGVVRVTGDSTLTLTTLSLTQTGVDNVVEVQLDLTEGKILGNVNKLSAASKYEIKLPHGVAGVRGTRYQCSADTSILLLDGTLIFVHIPPSGLPTPYILKAPPAVYFSPAGGIETATLEQLDQYQALAQPRLNPLQPLTSTVARQVGFDLQEVAVQDGPPITRVEPTRGSDPITPTTGVIIIVVP